LFFGLSLHLALHKLTLLLNCGNGFFNRIDRDLFGINNRLFVLFELLLQRAGNFGPHVVIQLGGSLA
jgi:hypothetical protein